MTNEEFTSRYRLLQPLTANGVRSYQARDAATGQLVMVHLLGSSPSESGPALLARIERLEASRRARVRAILEVDGGPVVVTDVLTPFVSLDAWLQDQTAAAPGDFTRVFGAPVSAPVSAPVDAPAPAPPAPPKADAPHGPPAASARPPASAPPAAPVRPGSFTELFGAGSAAPTPARPPAAAPPPPRAPSASAPPSERPRPEPALPEPKWVILKPGKRDELPGARPADEPGPLFHGGGPLFTRGDLDTADELPAPPSPREPPPERPREPSPAPREPLEPRHQPSEPLRTGPIFGATVPPAIPSMDPLPLPSRPAPAVPPVPAAFSAPSAPSMPNVPNVPSAPKASALAGAADIAPREGETRSSAGPSPLLLALLLAGLALVAALIVLAFALRHR